MSVKASTGEALRDRFWSKVDVRGASDCWPWTAAIRNKKDGYGAFWYHRRHIPATHMPFILRGINVPNGMEVCHRCDNPQCCNPAHLFIATRQANNDDKVKKRRHIHGSRVNTALLTAIDVLEIRSRVASAKRVSRYYGRAALAREFGVTEACISDIVGGRSWKVID